MTDPKRIDVEVTPGSSTEVEWDPHALTVTAGGLVIVPIEIWGSSQSRLGAVLYQVDRTGELTRLGMLDAGTKYELRPRRAIVLSDVIVTIGESGVLTWDRSSFDPIGSVSFPEPDWAEIEGQTKVDDAVDSDG